MPETLEALGARPFWCIRHNNDYTELEKTLGFSGREIRLASLGLLFCDASEDFNALPLPVI